jgi:hypothetical protein
MAKLQKVMQNPMDPANISILQSDPRIAKLMAKFGGMGGMGGMGGGAGGFEDDVEEPQPTSQPSTGSKPGAFSFDNVD